jgi:hypothetical protein
LACELFDAAAQILQNLLLALLYFEENRFRETGGILRGMNLARFQEDLPRVSHAFLTKQHLLVGIDHGNSNSTILCFQGFRPPSPRRSCMRLASCPRLLELPLEAGEFVLVHPILNAWTGKSRCIEPLSLSRSHDDVDYRRVVGGDGERI